ncbi:Gfo/Idh/MocA family oxidoreductase [Parasphingopyxis algicola]|uniref:Gfo/Idh/MocA family protein n=1 Tax=Parasphingopyxis algicola TaxID=2026624 RepID=UPI0015A41FC6|nr:Gfo/Idh/MocA family oxidoreductase [Parasphingopyxis algicola]QLC25232.1 Gfo/Idh/MocA family oxidoreductase [Parasphingopyxis algicola]
MTATIGLIGCGRWGKLVLRDLVACGAEVHVVCASSGNQAIAQRAGAASIVENLKELPPVDGYVVVTPTSTHGDIVLALMPRGKPIFVEKPLTADVDSARQIAEDDDGQVFVMDKWRYHSGVEAVRAQIAAGAIGRLRGLRLQRWSNGHEYADVSPLWILAPHDLSIADHILGYLPPLDDARAVIRAEPQLGFTAELGGTGPVSVTLDIGVANVEHARRVAAVGENGVMELRGGYETCLFVRRGPVAEPGQDVDTIPFPDTMPLLTEVRGFLDFLDGGPPPLADARKGCAIVEHMAEIETKLEGR